MIILSIRDLVLLGSLLVLLSVGAALAGAAAAIRWRDSQVVECEAVRADAELTVAIARDAMNACLEAVGARR